MRLALAFAWFGLFWGSFAVATYDLERFLRLGDAGFGTLLTLAVGAGIIANLGGGALARRWGSRQVLTRAVALWSVFEVALAVLPQPAAFAAVFVAGVGVSGLVDLGINVAGTARYSSRPGRLAQLHSLFNAGAVLGALGLAALLATGQSWRWAWAAIGVTGLPLAVALRGDPAAPAAEAEGPASPAVLRRHGLLLLAAAFCLAALVEGGTGTWGVLYLRAHLALSALAGAAGYAGGQVLAVLARLWLGPRIGALGGAAGAAAGALAAGLGLLVEALAPGPAAAAGLALAVLGISLCWPLLMSAAGRTAGPLPAIVGALVAVGYLGILVGPSVVGWISGAVGLRAGLVVLAGAAALSACAAALHDRRGRLT